MRHISNSVLIQIRHDLGVGFLFHDPLNENLGGAFHSASFLGVEKISVLKAFDIITPGVVSVVKEDLMVKRGWGLVH